MIQLRISMLTLQQENMVPPYATTDIIFLNIISFYKLDPLPPKLPLSGHYNIGNRSNMESTKT